jgi:hypothetical protein
MAENIAKSDDFTRGAEAPRPITVRFAPEIASRLEAEARERDASPTEIVRAIVCEHYSEAGRQTELMRELGELIEDRFRHLVYEISRTRSSLYNMVEQGNGFGLDRARLKHIQQLSRQNASDYLTRLDAEIEGRKNLGKASGAALKE